MEVTICSQMAVRRRSGTETVWSGVATRMYLSTDPRNELHKTQDGGDLGEYPHIFPDSAAGRVRRLNDSVQDESLPR